ncbi:MAG: amidohydrolase/deacetylase family metallohydrolase [Chloroflexi bacterium]|nr:amidohydrolase/deacetylase family metallohydrolase [Chloroflexota bacterium]
MNARYDLVLRGGEMIDPAQRVRGRFDVAISKGKVAAVAPSLPADAGGFNVDVKGMLVVPGLVDIHTHFYNKVMLLGCDPDTSFLPVGVTTSVDAGSSGWRTWAGLRDFVIANSRTRLYAFIHLSGVGLLPPELTDLSQVQVEETAECIAADRDVIVGIKLRVTSPGGTGEANAIPALEKARETADRAGSRIITHVGRSPIPLAQVVERLKPGDIVTHTFHGFTNTILDERGRVRREMVEARSRGVLFDVGHANVWFDAPIARAAIEQGFMPDTLSTDYTSQERTAGRTRYMITLLDVMSTFLALGMPLDRVISAVTDRPAAAIGKGGQFGSLKVGMPADIAVLELADRPVTYRDNNGQPVEAGRTFQHVITLREGAKVA